jgi:cation diffusion facilitator CzcD-associated flavoprotein CzcO
MEDVARTHGVLDRVHLGTEVERVTFDAAEGGWTLQTSAGTSRADIVIAACGQLSVPSVPAIPGRDDFAGPAFHTARWRHDVELEGKRVAVVGTGCSSIQAVPAIQPRVASLDVYQRSPGWTLPKMDYAYSAQAQRLFERFPSLQRLDRALTFGFMELATAAITHQRWLAPLFRALARRQIKQIDDPELRAKVTPGDEIGCKRMMLTDDWYRTLTRPNVSLIADRITQITPDGVLTADGTERPADVLIFGTGFRSHDFVAPMDVVGRDERTLEQAWADVPKAYLGITVPGFPNLFLLYGPNTNGGAGSVIYTIECAMRHVLAALGQLEQGRARTIEVVPAAADEFDRELRQALAGTVWHTGCTSWYVDERGNNPNQWPWLWTTYRRRTERLQPAAYALA